MLEENTTHSRELINAAQEKMSAYFQKPIHFSKVIQLSDPERRNVILRLMFDQPATEMPQSIILKQTVTDKGIFERQVGETEEEQLSRFAHDWAGLEFLTKIGGGHAPHFYAGNLEYKFILIEDLGLGHPSLVGPLTRVNTPDNVQAAEQALLKYMQRLGRMHADTSMKSAQFTKILNRVYPASHRLYVPESDITRAIMPFQLFDKNELTALQSEVDDVLGRALSLGEFNVLLHGDICPDNVYYKGDEVRLIDFEFGDFGSALIDGVYLRMHMPSCWCSKAIPETLLKKMEVVYRHELIKGIPAAENETLFKRQLIYACAYWLIRTINQIEELDLIEHEWVCPSGPVEADSLWDSELNTFRPRVLSRIESFVAVSAQTDYLPKLNELSRKLLSYLKKQWPEARGIEVFPVFKRSW